MAGAEGPSSSARRPPSVAVVLRQLWDSGQHVQAMRRALGEWDQLLAHDGDLGWLQSALGSCGLEAEALALQVQSCRRLGETRHWEKLIATLLRMGDPWWARELLEEAGTGSRNLERLRIEVELAVGDGAASIAAWTRTRRDEAALDAAIGWYVQIGRIADAERLVLEKAPGANLWRARFALWREQPDVARRALQGLPSSTEVRCCEAIATVQEGKLAEAEFLLRELANTEVRAEALSWLAAVLRAQHRYREAATFAEAASYASPIFNLAARLERELAVEYEATALHESGIWKHPWLRRVREVLPGSQRTIAQLEHAEFLYPLGLRPKDPIRNLEGLLQRFGGNRTLHLTTIENGTLTAYRLPLDPRYLGANVLRVFWSRGPTVARELFRALAPTVSDHPLFRIYAGELELWMGAYDEAERIFRETLARETKVLWGWIGLGASVMLQGRLGEAHEIWEHGDTVMGFRGPTVFVYRGECYRRQGEVALARRELEFAVQQAPQRLSAWINLALLNQDPEELERVSRECVAFAPLLMGTLRGSTAERLEGVLQAMRGNRRSSPEHISYHLWDRIWRRHASYQFGLTSAGASSATATTT